MRDLPKGWRAARLEEVCEINPRDSGPSDPTQLVSFVPMPAVSDEAGEITGPQTRPFEEVSKGYTRFRDGDVIFAKITPCMENGKIAVARGLHNQFACGSTEFYVLRSRGQVLPEYVWRFLRQVSFRKEAERHMTGAVGQRRVPAQYLKDSLIPLPPLDEQRHIVARLDALLACSKRARIQLTYVAGLVKRQKQAVLTEIFDEVSRIASQQMTLGALATGVRNGVARRPENYPPGISILKISAVRPMNVRMDEKRYYVLEPGEDVSSYKLQQGDLLFTRYNGNPELVANCGMVRDIDDSFIYPDKLIRVRANRLIVEPTFIELMVASKQVRDALAPYIKSAAGQHGISGADLKALSLPIPSLLEQNRIVQRAMSAFTRIDHTAAEAERAAALLDQLDQATLTKAFQGEL